MNISCLPIAGLENPYQSLMMKGLRESDRLSVCHGAAGKVFPLVRTAFKQHPDFIHIDWIHQYYLRRKNWQTYLQVILFLTDIILCSVFSSAKLVWTLHNIYPHKSAKKVMHKFVRTFFAARCQYIRVFSEGTKEKITNEFKIKKSKVIVIPEGDYVSHYPNTVSKKEARNYLKIEEAAQVFLFFGSIRAYKGIDELIILFKKIKSQNEKLVIAGNAMNPDYITELKQLIKEDKDIIFHPRMIPDEEVQYYMNAADIVVLPFKKIENSGSAILAMGFAKAVIAPNSGVLPKRLEKQQHLLYNNALSEIFNKKNTWSESELTAIGINNKKHLKKHKWEDFSALFLR